MTKYQVQVKASYYDELEIEADDVDEAYRVAIQTFKPCGDNMFSIDVYGLDPWTLGDKAENPHAGDPVDDWV